MKNGFPSSVEVSRIEPVFPHNGKGKVVSLMFVSPIQDTFKIFPELKVAIPSFEELKVDPLPTQSPWMVTIDHGFEKSEDSEKLDTIAID